VAESDSGGPDLSLGIGNELVDTADSFTSSSADQDVTISAPAGSPRVSNDIVRRRTCGVVSNSGDGMVDLSGALSVG